MLKFKITNEQYEALEEDIKCLYKQQGDAFLLEVDGIPKSEPNEDVSGLKEKVDELLKEKKKADEKRKAAEEEAERERLEKAKKDGDHATLLEAKDKELENAKKEVAETKEKLESFIKQQETKDIKAEALKRATAISSGFNTTILAEQMEKQLTMVEGQIVALGDDGKPSGEAVEKFTERYRDDKRYESLVDASKASGAGGSENEGGGAGQKAWHEMNADERTALYKKNPTLYNQMKNKSKG